MDRPLNENERFFISIILIVTINLSTHYLFESLFNTWESPVKMHDAMELSFALALVGGILFFILSGTQAQDFFIKRWKTNKKLSLLTRALNEDQMKILETVKDSEGITQYSLVNKTGFSKSKVSIILSEMEKNGLVTRDYFGKSYRVYLGESLK